MKNIILTDTESKWKNLLPFTFTRPVSEIRTGIFTFREKWAAYFPEANISYLTQNYLSGKYPMKQYEDSLFINSSILPDEKLSEKISQLQYGELLTYGDSFIAFRNHEIITRDGEITGYGNKMNYNGEVSAITYPWDIFRLNAAEIEKDHQLITKDRKSFPLSETNRVIGKNPIFIEEGVIAECCIFNTTNGSIYLGKNSVIMEGSMIQGPFAIGENSQIKMGARIYPGTTIGPQCKVGGEINNSVIFGYSNKAHDGFLGNAVIGEWCNIGADTNNSNLKNTYEEVKVWNYTQNSFKNTGLQFCGLFMGDHSKCGINTMFNTGTCVGVCANIFGAGFPRNFIPSFSWGGAHGFTEYKLSKAFDSIDLVMKRRMMSLSDMDKRILSHIFETTKEYRHF